MACWVVADRHVDVIQDYIDALLLGPSTSSSQVVIGIHRAQPPGQFTTASIARPAPNLMPAQSPLLTRAQPVAHPLRDHSCRLPSPCSLLSPTPVTRPRRARSCCPLSPRSLLSPALSPSPCSLLLPTQSRERVFGSRLKRVSQAHH